MMLDVTWLCAGGVLAHAVIHGRSAPWEPWRTALTLAIAASASLAFVLAGVYGGRRRTRTVVAYITVVMLLIVVAAVQVLPLVNADPKLTLLWLDAWLLAALLLMATSRALMYRWLRRGEDGRALVPRVIVAGQARHLARWAAPRRNGGAAYRIVGATGITGTPEERSSLAGLPQLEGHEELVRRARAKQFDELWLALPMSDHAAIQAYVCSLQHDFIDIRLLADAQELPLFNPAATRFGDAAFIDLVTSLREDDASWLKPLFDRMFAAAALMLLSPLMVMLAVAVKLSSPGPVFFRQRRKGMDGREFTILKFRSMHVHAEEAGKLTQARPGDERVTTVGRFLRRTSLDELPQFINVLLGQMSVVGPRPHAIEHDDLYMRLIDGYMYRYRIRPGMTGWAQVNGLRGETARVESMARRVAMDLFYIQHWSFWLDLKIVAMTIVKGFTGKNAY
jgi:putative colanic acid biosynthesis UDP-glucose lipid carrier transferase